MVRFQATVDRFDPDATRRYCTSVWPDSSVFRAIADVLADDIRFAHASAPASWSLTLSEDYLRLNVGQVEGATFLPDDFRLLALAPVDVPTPLVEQLSNGEAVYASVPVPSVVLYGPLTALDGLTGDVMSAQLGYVREAASRKTGTPHRRSYSPAAVGLIESTAGVPLPRPGWADEFAHLAILPLPHEVGSAGLWEGARDTVAVNVFERNPIARRACLAAAHGTDCVVCGFSFQMVYGPLGAGFIHVHHTKPLSEIGERYQVDPVADLRPVCPNCHAMLHCRTPPFTVDELRSVIQASPPKS